MGEVTAIVCTRCGMKFLAEPRDGRCPVCSPSPPPERKDPGPTLAKSVDCACCKVLMEQARRGDNSSLHYQDRLKETERLLEEERLVNTRLAELLRGRP